MINYYKERFGWWFKNRCSSNTTIFRKNFSESLFLEFSLIIRFLSFSGEIEKEFLRLFLISLGVL